MEKRYRIEYFDIAKGICIFLVLAHHISESYMPDRYPFRTEFMCFRMPLYFFLSGVFFKPYEGFLGFIRRKTNKLLVPFCFFYLTLAVALPYVYGRVTGAEMFLGYPTKDADFFLTAFWKYEAFQNGAIWFLLCLFEVNVLFYMLYVIANRSGKSDWVLLCEVAGCGLIGMLLSIFNFNLYGFLDTMFTVIPFYYMGYIIYRKTSLFTLPNKHMANLIIILLLWTFIILFATPVDYRINQFSGLSPLTAYPCGLAGIMMIIFLSKEIGHSPLLAYCGRYSIIILCTHIITFSLIVDGLVTVPILLICKWAICLVATILISILLIPPIKSLLPYVTAQKDLF